MQTNAVIPASAIIIALMTNGLPAPNNILEPVA